MLRRTMLTVLALSVFALASFLDRPAAFSLPADAFAPSAARGDRLLQMVDIFRRCQNIDGRWRCRQCKWVRRCDRGGCHWREQCRWGPWAPVIPQ